MKGVIVHRKNNSIKVMMITIKRYMNLCHKCLVMTKVFSGYFGDSLQLTNWVLDSGATCHMTPQVSYFISVSLEDTDKYIEVADIYHVTAKQKGQVQIKNL